MFFLAVSSLALINSKISILSYSQTSTILPSDVLGPALSPRKPQAKPGQPLNKGLIEPRVQASDLASARPEPRPGA